MVAFGANSRRGQCLICRVHGTDAAPLDRAHLVSNRERRAWHEAGTGQWVWHSNTIPLCRPDHVTFDDLCGIVRGPAWTILRYQHYTARFRVLL